MTMTEPVSTSIVGSVRVLAVGDPSTIVRGRPAEFRKQGVSIVSRVTAVSALLELGRDPSAVVLIPSALDDFPVLPFVDVLRSVAHVPVIAGVADDCSPHTLSELAEHGVAATIKLPATPTRLAEALQSTRASERIERVALTIGALSLDDDRYRITWHGNDVRVTPTQFGLLRDLMLAYPRILPIRALIESLEGQSGPQGVKTRVTVGRLRSALQAAAPDAGSPIETIHRVGYRLRL